MPSLSANQLRVPSHNGSPCNEYRIRNGNIEFRSTDATGQAYPYSHGCWRTLSPEDIQLHFALHTIVADWILQRLKLQD